MTLSQFFSFINSTIQGLFNQLANTNVNIDGTNINLWAIFLGGVIVSVFIGIITVIFRK